MAANTRDIRRRIKSVKNTAQITKAMQMVAASKMRKAQQAAIASRPYSRELGEMLKPFTSRLEEDGRVSHALLESREVKRELVLLISTDKGLCGALNTNLLREVSRFDADNTDFVCVGRKGVQFLTRSRRSVIAEFDIRDGFDFFAAQSVAKFCLDRYLSGEADRISVLYTHFVNTLQQTPTARVIAPVHSFEVNEGTTLGLAGESGEVNSSVDRDYILEPSLDALLDHLLPHFVYFKVYHLILESKASEHSARMVAMKNATDNAKQLIKDLTLEYNKIRQASITTEILEIATAQMVLS
ncbi:MAG: synthase gamma chain [Verrucomicrobiota bacterium]|jgi:F-type H+-transporting ATPase subunit gamma